MKKNTYLLVCGAIAKEVLAVLDANNWQHIEVDALPAILHNSPDKIPAMVDIKLSDAGGRYQNLLVGYADCGTGGMLDPVLTKHDAKRLDGPHCYSFFAGHADFEAMAEDELGTFYLTDYLVRQFDTVFWKSMGLDRYPELLSSYFGHYKRVIYLAQIPDPDLDAKAEQCAARLGLEYKRIETGLAPFDKELSTLV